MGWRKKDKSTTVSTPVAVTKTVVSADTKATVIGPSIAVDGTVRADENMWIAGQVNGEIVSEKQITIAQSGRVEGAIRCQSITISGEVKGNVHATEQITIEQTGRLVGDITTKILTNQPGGFFEGYSHMLQEGASRQPGGEKATATAKATATEKAVAAKKPTATAKATATDAASEDAKGKRSGKGTDQVEEGKKA